MRRRALLAAAACAAAATATAQPLAAQRPRLLAPDWVGSNADYHERLRQLTGEAPLRALMIRPLALRPLAPDDTAGGGLDLAAFPPSVLGRYNTAVPSGMNDGAMWAGRGAALSVDGGVQARWGVLTARVVPTYAWAENRAFALAELFRPDSQAPPYADQWWSGKIDRPQRFGEGTFSRLTPGQTVLRGDWRGAAAGLSTQNLWWGPGIDNSLLMSNTAEGIPHAFAGTSRPASIGIGRLEAMYLAGRLYDSDYWLDGDVPNRNRRWMSAFVAVFEPRGAPGLYLGGGRVFYEYIPAGGLGAADLLAVFSPFQKKKHATPDNPDGNDASDQMLSFWGRWVFPQVGFEVYGEWGRNDHAWDGRDFILEPDHASATLVGFGKVFGPRSAPLYVRGEATSLGGSMSIAYRSQPPWYQHHMIRQGYTQRGQLVGAGIGTGSNMQKLSVDWHPGPRRLGAHIERIRIDDDAFYRRYGDEGRIPSNHLRHDVIVGVGARAGTQWRELAVDAETMVGFERNRYTIHRNNVRNARATLRVEWAPPRDR